MKTIEILCNCGCNRKIINPDKWYRYRQFIHGHSSRKHKIIKRFCKCGCKIIITTPDKNGREVLFVHGHNTPKGKNSQFWKNEKKNKPNCIKCNKKLAVYTSKTGLCLICAAFARRVKINKRNERHQLMRRSEYILWRAAVFMRDNYTCQMCKVHGGKLEADHIKPWALYPNLRYAIDNGRTLCKECHRKTDTWGRRAKMEVDHL